MSARNIKALTDTRLLTTIQIGIAAGILGFDGLMGIVFFCVADLIVSIIMCLRFGFTAAPYFESIAKVFSTGLLSNVMTFNVTWILFHNLVYIL